MSDAGIIAALLVSCFSNDTMKGSYQSMGHKNGKSYQSIPGADDGQDISSDLIPAARRKRCCKRHKSFLSGIMLGVFLAFARTLYEDIRLIMMVYQSSSSKHITHEPKLHTLNTLLHLHSHNRSTVSIGPRPYFLINEMDDSNPELKSTLQKCSMNIKSFRPSNFVLGHRGAALQFPEHTDRSHDAATRMGAGIVECDINLTKDKQLICRHERCDLHLTTNVLVTPLASKCTQPFRPAIGSLPATAKCCTTDFTLSEIQNQMCGRMSSSNKNAKTPHQYISHTKSFQTDLYAHDCPHIQSHKNFMDVVNANGGSFSPEYKMLDYKFTKHYTRQMFLERVLADYNHTDPSRPLVDNGVTAIAPSISMLLEVDKNSNLVPTLYAKVAKELGLDIVAWTLERSDALSKGGSWYYSTISQVLRTDSDVIKVLDVLYEDVGIMAIWTDWPSIATFYANCKGILLSQVVGAAASAAMLTTSEMDQDACLKNSAVDSTLDSTT
eukprot:scaffold981_cov144-Skeletonema_menzelii.AAC.5